MMQEVICTNPSMYWDALTRGQRYPVLAWDEAKQQVKIQGDNGRVRWYPALCFDVSEENARSLRAYTLWIEREAAAPGSENPATTNTDALLTFADGTRWWATFFTYANITALSEKNRQTGENLSGKYFWAPHMILIDDVSRPQIEEVVAHLIETCEYHQIFARITSVDDERDSTL